MVTLEEITVIRAPVARCFDLARSVEVHLLGNTHYGERAVALAGVSSGLIGLGESVTWQARHFGVRQRLTSQLTQFDYPAYFQDTMLQGAFAAMQHDHYFRALDADQTEMRDVFRFAAPLGVLGRIAEVLVLRRYMQKLLRERNQAVREIAESDAWQQYLPTTAEAHAKCRHGPTGGWDRERIATVAPCSAKRRATYRPMKPLPPAITMLGLGSAMALSSAQFTRTSQMPARQRRPLHVAPAVLPAR